MLSSLPKPLNWPNWLLGCRWHGMAGVPRGWWHLAGCQTQGQSDVGVVSPSSPSVLENLKVPGKKEVVGNWRPCSCLQAARVALQSDVPLLRVFFSSYKETCMNSGNELTGDAVTLMMLSGTCSRLKNQSAGPSPAAGMGGEEFGHGR